MAPAAAPARIVAYTPRRVRFLLLNNNGSNGCRRGSAVVHDVYMCDDEAAGLVPFSSSGPHNHMSRCCPPRISMYQRHRTYTMDPLHLRQDLAAAIMSVPASTVWRNRYELGD